MSSLCRGFFGVAAVGLVAFWPALAPAVCESPDVVYLQFRNRMHTTYLHTAVPDTITAWLINPSAPAAQVTGFDLRLVTDAAPGVLQTAAVILPAGAVNGGTTTDLSVTFPPGTLIDVDGRIELARLAISVTTGDCCPIYLKASGISGLLTIRSQTGGTFPINPASGSHLRPVAAINCQSSFPICVAADGDFGVAVNYGSSSVLVGASTIATNGYDPGLESTTSQRVWIPRPEWPAESARYGQDIKAVYDPLLHMRQWTFKIDVSDLIQSGTFIPGTRTITFNPSFAESEGIGMILRDPDLGFLGTLWPGLEYTRYFPTNREYSFDLLVGTNTASPTPDMSESPANTILAFPNPFNPQVQLSVSVAGRGRVEIRIFDARGACIRTLPLGMVEAGQHRVNWDGNDSHGKPVSGGTYFAAIDGNGNSGNAVTKISLVR